MTTTACTATTIEPSTIVEPTLSGSRARNPSISMAFHCGVAVIDAKRRVGSDQIDIDVGACHSHDAEGDDESLRVSPREGSETQRKERRHQRQRDHEPEPGG